jgi:isopentenyl-diphosphate delta-isomerase
MPKVTSISSRKSDHIRINLQEEVNSGVTTGLENYCFIHRALPEINLDDVDLKTSLFGRTLNAPILISSMTGGTQEAGKINRILAQAAQEMGVAMGLGSQRIAIEQPDLAPTFQVRNLAPNVLLLANLGAIQLNYGYSIEECQRAVDMLEADALILHFNPLQEAIQTGGNTSFNGLIHQVEKIVKSLSVPVIAKEVGWGFSEEDILLLFQAGVKAIDVAGAGGTSWSQVEMYRAKNESQARLATAFKDWGISTSEVIVNIREVAPEMLIFASGGLRTGVDISKCIALGASLGGMASPFLKAAVQSVDMTIQTINELMIEIQVCMFASGADTIDRLKETPLVQANI